MLDPPPLLRRLVELTWMVGVGTALSRWQRRAARQGSRGTQPGIG